MVRVDQLVLASSWSTPNRMVVDMTLYGVIDLIIISQENASCMSPALGSGLRGLSKNYRLKTCGEHSKSPTPGAIYIYFYILLAVDPGGFTVCMLVLRTTSSYSNRRICDHPLDISIYENPA